MPFSRRQLLVGAGSGAALAGLGAAAAAGSTIGGHGAAGADAGYAGATPPATRAEPAAGLPEMFPTQAPEEVRELVIAAHFNLARVRELVTRRPSLARATWDWGFGDWESALGAASHMGNRPIAEFLLGSGARPDLFSAAMLGNLDVVRAHLAAWPGAQQIKGPHGITLLAHARSGGEPALAVLRFLTELGDANPVLPVEPLAAADRSALAGRYRCGPQTRDVFTVEPHQDGLSLRRADAMGRPLSHLGSRVFSPPGADTVRIRFSAESPAATLTIYDPGLVVTARRAADGGS
jgi:hypothetical protein